jgi:hypothetical protein
MGLTRGKTVATGRRIRDPAVVVQETPVVGFLEFSPQIQIGPNPLTLGLIAMKAIASIALAAANSKFKRPDGPQARMVCGHRHKEKIEF